jgi:hypothetical protein
MTRLNSSQLTFLDSPEENRAFYGNRYPICVDHPCRRLHASNQTKTAFHDVKHQTLRPVPALPWAASID